MSQPAQRAGEAEAGAQLDAVEESLVEAAIAEALAPYRATLAPQDLAWMRERLLEGVREDASLHAIVRAAAPRDVDQSGEVVRAGKPRDR